MSKLCCLGCWHLLRVLRGNSKDFHVRGHHNNLTQVELPQWLPCNVVVEVTTAFEKILLREIESLQRRTKVAPSHSGDSLGGLSPESSDGEDDIAMFQRRKERSNFPFLARDGVQ